MKKTKKFVSHQNDTFSGVRSFKSSSRQDNKSELDIMVKKAIDHYTNNKINDALGIIQNLLQNHPDIAILYTIKGACFVKTKQFDLALEQYNQALKITPKNADIYYNLGVLFDEQGNFEKAVAAYLKAITFKPDAFNIYNNLGSSYKSLNQAGLAIESFKKALKRKKDYPEAYYNLGIMDLEQGRLKQAVYFFKQAINYRLDYVDALNNLGITYSRLDNLDLAIDCFNKCIQFSPSYPEAYFNLGLVYQKRVQFDLEIDCYRQAIKYKPDYVDANWNLALVLLLKGYFEEGWKQYTWRFKKEEIFALRKYSKPLWDGSSLKNKTLFIYHEQGVGDTLQYIRYVKLLSKQGVKIILGCPSNLLRLMAVIPEINHLTVSEKELPDFDFFIPMMSIPAILKSDLKTIPNNVPYIYTDKKIDHSLIQNHELFNIGFVWAGNPKHHNDKNRSVELSFFKPLLALEEAQFYSLQVGERSNDLTLDSAYANVIDLSSELNDYEDTASIIQQLDLVITVDTSVAHLAGAMGQPVWLLLPCVPDWRWLMDRTDSPWYPTMRLFRQQTYKDWQPVFTQLRKALKQKLKMSVQDLRLLKLFWLVIHAFKQQNINIGIYYLSELLVMINTFSKNLPESKIHQIKLILNQVLTDLKAQNYSNFPIICEEKLLPLLGLSLVDYLSWNN